MIELAEGVNKDKVEYAVSVALKKPGSESYADPLMMEEPSEGKLVNSENNRFRSSGHWPQTQGSMKSKLF